MDDKLTPFLPMKKSKEGFQKIAFYTWLEVGNCTRATKMLSKRGIINPRTGKPYTYMALYLASYIYLVNNHEELKPVLFEIWDMRDDVMTDKEWDIYIVRKATVALGNSSKKLFLEWVDNNLWARKYDYIYAKRFGLKQTSGSEV